MIAPWALLLLFYFLRRLGKQGEMIGQIAGVVTAAVAVLRYEELNDWAVRLLGIGSRGVDAGRPRGRWRVGRLCVALLFPGRWRDRTFAARRADACRCAADRAISDAAVASGDDCAACDSPPKFGQYRG